MGGGFDPDVTHVRSRGTGVIIAVIIGATIVMLACIAATTWILVTFLQNPPWLVF